MRFKGITASPMVVFIFAIYTPLNIYGQVKYGKEEVGGILTRVSEKLNSIQTVSYEYNRNTFYSGENYRHSFSTHVYIDFTASNNNAGYRFQTANKKDFSCYNGVQYFSLQRDKRIIDIQQKPDAELFESLSALYNSYISLRNILPLIIRDNSIRKNITDTTIDNKDFYLLQVNLNNHYFTNLGGKAAFTPEYIGDKNKPYEIIMDKTSMLPYQYISKFKDKPADFIEARFTDVDTNPNAPEALSWFYSTYTSVYSLAGPKKMLITKDEIPENWVLPVYSPEKTDSVSLYQYRGKIVMLDFWIKSCGPCLASFAHLNKLQQKFGTEKFQLLSINTEDKKEDIEFFYKKHKPVYKMLFNGEALVDSYGIPAFPAIIILNRAGKIIYVGDNGFDQVAIEKVIKKNL